LLYYIWHYQLYNKKIETLAKLNVSYFKEAYITYLQRIGDIRRADEGSMIVIVAC